MSGGMVEQGSGAGPSDELEQREKGRRGLEVENK